MSYREKVHRQAAIGACKMKKPTPDFPRLTTRQIELLEKIKAGKEKLETLFRSVPESGVGVPELEKIHNELDKYTDRSQREEGNAKSRKKVLGAGH